MFKAQLKRFLSPKLRTAIRRGIRMFSKDINGRFLSFKAILSGGSLDELGRFYRSDKVTGHYYSAAYMFHFDKYRKKGSSC